MVQTNKLHFIVIDDSKLDCFIAEKIIRNTGKIESFKSFLQAKEALEYMAHAKPDEDATTYVLVDIQMPVMNGFEFVEAFENFPWEIKKNYTLFVISSSINDNDLNKVQNYSSVKQFINKPLTSHNLEQLLETTG
jgi:CheY-like chemotaxis protein